MHQVLTVNLLSQPKAFMYHRIKFFLLSSLACFTAVFMASAQKQPQDTLTFERSWSHGLNLYTSGTDHYGIAVDISNRAWIVNGSGIYVFTADTGTALTNWAVANARALRFDSVSNLFFVCSRQNTSPQVRIYKPSYTLITQWGTNSLSDPSGIAVDLNGSVFIADYGNSRINVFNRKGDYQSQFSVSTSPTDVAVTPDDFVYVSGNYFVGCYSSAGPLSVLVILPPLVTFSLLGPLPHHPMGSCIFSDITQAVGMTDGLWVRP